MKSLIKISCIAVFFLSLAVSTQAQKFGYVNSAAILAELPEVKQADANLEALQKQLQKKGQSMVEQLQQDYLAVQQQVESGSLSPKQQEEEAAKLQKREQEIAKFEQDMRQQLNDKREELLNPIYEKVNNAIQDVAKENGFQFIFDQGVLLYAEDSQNVNSMVKAKLGM
ncbi:OmpH family outer membrane protein [Phaeodactylibacter luteus]|uniref:OmpH family outer membrane protein n=1 Tax=Phaeodactylibacter luteus TaxID=1564516 RepID=A0A5C6RKN0_9BACT|nr:OmpH family outer membrane protein [Phaeodactylibacter luteus]TXB62514.1 OmpH family outer membrane protein [Phaeodactylibacter luteus]